jgi:alanine racemase
MQAEVFAAEPHSASQGARGPAHRLPATRPTRAEIDLSALASNLRAVRSVAGSSRVFVVVKADAYGHGLVQVARRLERERVDGLCVALAEEGLALRACGVTAQILVLNGVYGEAHERVLAAHLTPVVYSLEQSQAFARASRELGNRPVSVHLKIDTGMARLGVQLDELAPLLDAIESLPVRIDGVMTHLSSADSDVAETHAQLARFDGAVAALRARGHRPRFVHAANSAATYMHEASRYDLVRTGLVMYGIAPPGAPPGADDTGLTPVMSVRTELIALRDLPAGAPVGYDQTFRTARPSRIATVPMGYGDGLMRSASNRGQMLVRGQRCPIVGRVSMDLTTLDVTDMPEVAVGDDVVLFGQQGEARLSAVELAEASGTIAYEVLTSISPRVPRIYL